MGIYRLIFPDYVKVDEAYPDLKDSIETDENGKRFLTIEEKGGFLTKDGYDKIHKWSGWFKPNEAFVAVKTFIEVETPNYKLEKIEDLVADAVSQYFKG